MNMDSNKMMVRVSCSTFNQAPYIVDAMNGFCMQETTFPFVCTIGDDASTDGEQDVIKKYLQEHFDLEDKTTVRNEETDDYVLTFAQHKTNRNCYFAVLFLKYNHYSIKKSKTPYIKEWQDHSKYIAICEGDDYWTHPQKLQMQVDFLEEHDDYSCCCHRFKIYYENTDTWEDDYGRKAFDSHPFVDGLEVTNSENFLTRFTSTLTLCYRKSAADEIVWPPYKFGHRDFNFHYHLLKLGKCWCFADYMGVYRKNNGGVWSRLSSVEGAKIRLESYEDMYKYNSEDNVVLACYSIWLDRFFANYVLPLFSQYKLTKNGMNILCYYYKHCLKTKNIFAAFKNSVKCLVVLLGLNKLLIWRK